MDTIFNDVCVQVTAAFALTLVPGFRHPARSLLSGRDQGTALLVFMSLGLLEEATAFHAGWLSQRIVAVCACGLVVRATESWLEMSVGDDGQGVASTEVEQLFFRERPRVHALVLLRRRLQGLFGRSFQLKVRSEIGEGTTVIMRIPLRKRLGANLESPRAITLDVSELAPS
jgi:hypothetical protein